MSALGRALPAYGDDVSSEELVQACLENIELCESDVSAWVAIDREGALAQARRCDQESPSRRGIVHGMPIGIKDIVDVAGFPTRAGSKMPAKEASAKADAPLVANLRHHGAVILGKTVTTEFACFDPPPTRNPHRLDRTPGGSSSGSAAAVASGMCLAAVGSQTGGSITRPASFCGVVGWKPAMNDVALNGVVPISPRLDHPGPIGRNVGETYLVWQAMRSLDAVPLPSPLKDAPLTAIEEFFFGERCDSSVAEATRAALSRFVAEGYSVAFENPPVDFEEVLVHHRCIMAVDCAAFHRQTYTLDVSNYGPHVWSLIQEGLAVLPERYRAAIAFQKDYRRTMADWLHDRVAVMPSTTSTAPGLATTGDPAFNAPWSLSGLPTLSLPIGSVDCLPVGLQLVGTDQRKLFATGLSIEQRL